MKKTSLIAFLIVFGVSWSVRSWSAEPGSDPYEEIKAQDKSGYYFGMGMNYAQETFSTAYKYEPSTGLNLRAGKQVSDSVSIELNYNRLPNFRVLPQPTIIQNGGVISRNTQVKLMTETYTVSGKIVTSEWKGIRPFFSFGVGIISVFKNNISVGYTRSDYGLCFSPGMGLEKYMDDDFSVWLGVDYLFSQSLHDKRKGQPAMISDLGVSWISWVCGTSYHF